MPHEPGHAAWTTRVRKAAGTDQLTHAVCCGHDGDTALKTHKTGVAAHVAIYLAPGADIWDAYEVFDGLTVTGVTVEKIHVATGEIDMIADIHAAWSDGVAGYNGQRGFETRMIGLWVNKVRTAQRAGAVLVGRTSTAICMSPDP